MLLMHRVANGANGDGVGGRMGPGEMGMFFRLRVVDDDNDDDWNNFRVVRNAIKGLCRDCGA